MTDPAPQQSDDWYETVGTVHQCEVSFRNQKHTAKVCVMKDNDSFLANLGAVLLQINQAQDCDDAVEKMSAHAPEKWRVNSAPRERYCFCHPQNLQSNIENC